MTGVVAQISRGNRVLTGVVAQISRGKQVLRDNFLSAPDPGLGPVPAVLASRALAAAELRPVRLAPRGSAQAGESETELGF